MIAALMRLGLSQLAGLEFTDNGITMMNHLRMQTEESLDRLIKQIHRDNQGAGLFIPFASQQYQHAICFWAKSHNGIFVKCVLQVEKPSLANRHYIIITTRSMNQGQKGNQHQ
jgi:hypothetical protein